MLKSASFRLYPTAVQKEQLARTFGAVRWVYNRCLAIKSSAWDTEKKDVSRFRLSAELTKWRNSEDTSWLKEPSVVALQQAIAHLEVAYAKLFKKKRGYPNFKNKRSRQAFVENACCHVFENTIKIPKIGKIKAVISRQVDGEVKSITISKTTTGKYFASVLYKTEEEFPIKFPVTEKGSLGIDLGLTHFATLSTGEKIENPRCLRKSLKKIKRAQRRMSKSQKGSKNRDKKRHKLAILHEKVTNKRKDFLHKLTTRLVKDNQFDTFCIEDLAVKNMSKNHKLALSISDAGWAEFRRQLTYKCDWYGKNLLVIGRFEPSSKTCTCGLKKDHLKLNERQWSCSCGLIHDRDLLAASNIKCFSLKNLKQSLGAVCPESTLAEMAH